jgi:uncharacterized protein YxeA
VDQLDSPGEYEEYKMKTTAFLAIGVFFSINVTAIAATEIVISQNNEYGGLTKQIVYSEEDSDFKKGMGKIIASYDKEGSKKKMEIYATESHAKEKGWYKKVIYYWGRKKVSEAYSTDSDSAKYGFHQMVSYFDKDNRLEKREYYLNKNTTAAQLGVYKRVVHYDGKGKISYVEDLDRRGNLVLIE